MQILKGYDSFTVGGVYTNGLCLDVGQKLQNSNMVELSGTIPFRTKFIEKQQLQENGLSDICREEKYIS